MSLSDTPDGCLCYFSFGGRMYLCKSRQSAGIVIGTCSVEFVQMTGPDAAKK